MKRNKKSKLSTTTELIMHTPSPIAASLINYKPKTFTPLKFKHKYKNSYKKEIREYF